MGAGRPRCDCPCTMTAALFQISMVGQAVEETITTPTPGVGHGRLGDVAAVVTCVAGFFGLF
jgi:hypothetical protein